MDFEWDDRKATANEAKHGVSFAEAQTVFYNPIAAIFDDDIHSTDEAREIIVGHSQRNRILVISFVERPAGIRIVKCLHSYQKGAKGL